MRQLIFLIVCVLSLGACKVKSAKDSDEPTPSSEVLPTTNSTPAVPSPTPTPRPTPTPIPVPAGGSSEGYLEFNAAAYTWNSDDDSAVNDCWVDHDPGIVDLGLNPYGPYKKLDIMIENLTGPKFQIQSYYYFKDLMAYDYYDATLSFTGYFFYNRIDIYGPDGTWGSYSSGTGRPRSSSCEYRVRKVGNRIEGSFNCTDLYKVVSGFPVASTERNANGKFNCEIRSSYN